MQGNKSYPDIAKKMFEKIDYDNLYFPFEDCYRQDRIVAYSHKTNNIIEIYNNPYPLKYNHITKKIMKITLNEYEAIEKVKDELGWCKIIGINYLLSDKEEVI